MEAPVPQGTLTPSQKATELINKFLQIRAVRLAPPSAQFDSAIQAAILCVDEILSINKLETTKGKFLPITPLDIKYWKDVRKELEKQNK